MENKRLILHIGLPKTGSTSLQSFLRKASQEDLLTQVDYPLLDSKMFYEQMESGNAGHLGHYVRHTNLDNYEYKEVKNRFLALTRARKFPDRPLLLSFEGFWPSDEKNLDILLEVIAHQGYQVEIFCCVRNFPDFWRSALSQHTRHFYPEISAMQTLDAYVQRVNYWFTKNFPIHIVEHTQDVLGNVLTMLGEDLSILNQFDVVRVNEKLTSSEALLLGKLSQLIHEPENWLIRISNELRYEDTQGILRDSKRQEFLLEENRNLEPPISWRLEEAMKRIKDLHNNAPSEDQKKFWKCVLGNHQTLEINVENTPALIASKSATSPSIEEWSIAISALSTIFQRTEAHSRNLQAEIDTLKLGSISAGSDPSSQLIVSNLGFDPVHYLILNPDVDVAKADALEHYLDFGIAEGRQTTIFLKERKNTIPASCVMIGFAPDDKEEFELSFDQRFNHSLVDFRNSFGPSTQKPRSVILATHALDRHPGTLARAILASASMIVPASMKDQEVAKLALMQIVDFEFIGLTSRWEESLTQFENQFLRGTVPSTLSRTEETNSAKKLSHNGDDINVFVMEFLNAIFDARRI